MGDLLEEIAAIFKCCLHPDKDPEMRLKFFALLSRLVLSSATTINSKNRFGEFAQSLVKDIILPNCVWRAGRTAAAIRTTAVSCLWALLQSGVLTKEKVGTIVFDTVTCSCVSFVFEKQVITCSQLFCKMCGFKKDVSLWSFSFLQFFL